MQGQRRRISVKRKISRILVRPRSLFHWLFASSSARVCAQNLVLITRMSPLCPAGAVEVLDPRMDGGDHLTVSLLTCTVRANFLSDPLFPFKTHLYVSLSVSISTFSHSLFILFILSSFSPSLSSLSPSSSFLLLFLHSRHLALIFFQSTK